LDSAAIRIALRRWYKRNHRDLPWRRTRDPYAIWISETMLQQTRVAAVIPYYQRFLERFPDPSALAAASEDQVLALWSGLGYYSRARNLHKAAQEMVATGAFPTSFRGLRELPGIGDYTASAVASIAFGKPHAVVDGNVRRVIMRLSGSAEVDVTGTAESLLDHRDPGGWNQALMELGAVVCLPRQPACGGCPLARHCRAQSDGTALDLPPKRRKPAIVRRHHTLLIVRKNGRILLASSARVGGFWDLPEPGAWYGSGVRLGEHLGSFRHAITNSQYTFEVYIARARSAPPGCAWWPERDLKKIPLSTTAKKALACL
jgi:A/G-specific adenine glycosylase